jgi:hypothetical protein
MVTTGLSLTGTLSSRAFQSAVAVGRSARIKSAVAGSVFPEVPIWYLFGILRYQLLKKPIVIAGAG